MDLTHFTAAVFVVAAIAVAQLVRTRRKNRELERAYAALRAANELSPPRKSAEEQRSEHLDRQLKAVNRADVIFTKRRVMGRGEFEVLALHDVQAEP